MGERVRGGANRRIAVGSGTGDQQAMALEDFIAGPRDWARTLTVATAAGVFLGLVGPFGSYSSGNAGVRIVYWTAMFWAGALLLGPSVRSAVRLSPRLGLPLWFAVAAAVMIACLPLAALSAMVCLRLWPQAVARLGPADWYLETLLLAAPVSAGMVWFERRMAGAAAVDQPAPAAPLLAAGTGFLSRLPPRLGRDLMCLEMEDHYVRAHTAAGSDLILIPLRQAMAELEDVDGLQVHRSWWVARSALAGASIDGRNVKLILRNGLQAPVARNRIAHLRAEGWLAG
jgi:hypothetical protein